LAILVLLERLVRLVRRGRLAQRVLAILVLLERLVRLVIQVQQGRQELLAR
jgi:hypothetical protein